jgi:PPOX class probable F420-dependent enzyme
VKFDPELCRARLFAARVAYLASTGSDQHPHVVPITCALDDDTLGVAIDQKPKSTTDLRRLRNIAQNPRVAILCDHYSDDWRELWWVRADGVARLVTAGPERSSWVSLLTAKYPQYRDDPPLGPVIVVDVDTWVGWSFGPTADVD